MNINSDGAEIEEADNLEVYGEWIKFEDGEGSIVKIPPNVAVKLAAFALARFSEFEDGAWS